MPAALVVVQLAGGPRAIGRQDQDGLVPAVDEGRTASGQHRRGKRGQDTTQHTPLLLTLPVQVGVRSPRKSINIRTPP